MALKPGPKPIADSTGKPDQRRRDNKNTPGNNPDLKPSKSSKKLDVLLIKAIVKVAFLNSITAHFIAASISEHP